MPGLIAILGFAFSLQSPQQAHANLDSASATKSGLPPAMRTVAVRAEKPPVIDGVDSDAVWRAAKVISDFQEWRPTEGAKARFRTEAKIAYDAANLYVFVRAFDPHPDSIIKILERRDTWTPSDMIWVFVDSFHDHRTGYEFGVNAAGTKMDQAIGMSRHGSTRWAGPRSSGFHSRSCGTRRRKITPSGSCSTATSIDFPSGKAGRCCASRRRGSCPSSASWTS